MMDVKKQANNISGIFTKPGCTGGAGWLNFTRLWVLYSIAKWNIKGGIQAEDIWRQDTEENIWAQEGAEWGVEKDPHVNVVWC